MAIAVVHSAFRQSRFSWSKASSCSSLCKKNKSAAEILVD